MLSPWNVSNSNYAHIELEDDTLREGLQSGSVANVPIDKMEVLLKLSSQVGIKHSVIGFPVNTHSLHQVERLLSFIDREKLKLRPWVLARFHQQDINTVINLKKQFPQIPLGVALFKSSNPERARIENWPADHFQIEAPFFVKQLNNENIGVSINFEDATRTPESCFVEILRSLEGLSVESWALCDTVGCAFPQGVKNLITFFVSLLKTHESQKIVWHGHNDLGLALANSLAALEAGASVISGTFLGIGERAGNVALEQMVAYLYFSGEIRFKISELKKYFEAFESAFNWKAPSNMPFVGEDVFSTHAGTHAAAMIKALKNEDSYKDLVYNAFSPTLLGYESVIKVGPLSGRGALKNLLDKTGLPYSEETVNALEQYLKSEGIVMDQKGVLEWLN